MNARTVSPKIHTSLTDTFFAVFALCQLLGVMSLVFKPLLAVYVLIWPCLLVWMWVERRLLPRAQIFSGEIACVQSPEIGQNTLVDIFLSARAGLLRRRQRLFLLAPELRTLVLHPQRLLLSPSYEGGFLLYQASVSATAARLGYETISRLKVQVYSPWRCWFKTLEIDVAPAELRVMPSKKAISEKTFTEMSRQRNLLHSGVRRVVRGHAAEQFYSIRKYQYPDPRRHIDVRKTAKWGQLMTRMYDSFYDHHLIIALDLGRSMCGLFGASQKYDYYLSAALALAQHASLSRDRISFFAFSQKVHYFIRNTRHLDAFRPLFHGHAALTAREEESNFDLIFPALTQLTGQRSIVLVLSDLSRPSVQAALLKSLRPVLLKHLTFVVGLLHEDYALDKNILAFHERHLSPENYQRLLYAYWLDESLKVFQNQMMALGGGALVVPEKEWLSSVEKLYALLRQSQRL